MKDYNGNEIERMEVYISIMVDVKGRTESEAYNMSSKLFDKVEDVLNDNGIKVYDTYEVFRDDDGNIIEPVHHENVTCNDCAWHVKVHYNGTPDDEVYDECELHYEVLHDLDICKAFTTERDE